MKKSLLALLFLVVGFAASPSFALDRLRGEYTLNGQTYGFTVDVENRSYAQLYWDDNTPGVVAYYNPNPRPGVKCPCAVYENGPRRIVVEHDFSGNNIAVHYFKFQR